MKRITAIIALMVVIGLIGVSNALAQCEGCKDAAACKVESEVKGVSEVKTEPNQKTCPVMGKPVNKEIYADHNGERIYFCCKGCVEAFNKNPDKYLEAMKKDGIVLEKAPCEACTSEATAKKHGEGRTCESCEEQHGEKHEHKHNEEKK